MKNKILAFAVSAAILFGGCAFEPPSGDSEKLSIVTTIFPPYDFARRLGGDKVELSMLVTPGGESHSYEPTPQDILAVKDCDIFICAGGESDVWTKSILSSIETDEITVIRMMDCVEAVEEELVEGMQAEEDDHSHEEIEYDEHVWTSLRNAEKISGVIADAMKKCDPENAEKYDENLSAYLNELSALDDEFEHAVQSAKRTTLVFGDRFPFRYLVDDYGLDYFAAFPGCSTETDVSASVMSFLIEKVQSEKIPVVYYIEFSAQRIADTIASETGAETLLFHSCHTVSGEEFNEGITYLELMRQNLESLKRGLN